MSAPLATAIALLVGALAGVSHVSFASSASACECEMLDPSQVLERAPAAFVGRVLTVEEAPFDPELGPRLAVTFEVLEAIKGAIDETATVYSSTEGSSCGGSPFAEEEPSYLGRTLGVVVDRSGHMSNGACGDLNPIPLQLAADGLPPPADASPAHALIVGDWMGVGAIFLGPGNAISAYGDPINSSRSNAVVCGDETTIAEAVYDDSMWRLEWRDLATWDVIMTLPLERSPTSQFNLLACAAQQRVLLLDEFGGAEVLSPEGRLIRLPGWRTAAISADGSLLVAQRPDGSISASAVATGSRVIDLESSALAPGFATAIAVSPDASKIAAATADLGTTQLAIIDVATGSTTWLPLPDAEPPETLWWLDNTAVAVAGNPFRVICVSGDPCGYETTTVDDVVAVGGTRVLRSTGSGHVVVDLADGTSVAIEPVPAVRANPNAPIVLPRPLDVSGSTSAPVGPPTLPLPGIRVPATLDELIATHASVTAATPADVSTADADGDADGPPSKALFLIVGIPVAFGIVLCGAASRYRRRPS